MDYALQVHRLRGDPTEVANRANAMVAFAAEQHLSEHRAKGMLFRGWAAAILGDVSRGIGDMRAALAQEEDAGTPEELPLYYEMFAEVCQRAGRADEGLAAVSKGLAQAERARLVYWNAELRRRQGELFLTVGGEPSAVAGCFEQALAEARAQGAHLLELRAAASLARLRRDEGRAGDVLPCLQAAYSSVSSRVDTPDLRDARALLVGAP
jgi:adenylate cyclase